MANFAIREKYHTESRRKSETCSTEAALHTKKRVHEVPSVQIKEQIENKFHGSLLKKYFTGFGAYIGCVVGHSLDDNLYLVEYTDGDREELAETDLQVTLSFARLRRHS
jgi:hypothetical protein